MNSTLAALVVLAGTSAPASVPADFAWHWPLDVADQAGLVRLELEPRIYARLARADLADLMAFDAAGEPLAMAPEREMESADGSEPAPVPLPWFVLPPADPHAEQGVDIMVERGADGRVLRVRETGPMPTQEGRDILVDLSAFDEGVAALLLVPAPAAHGQLNARFEVAASDDLSRWRTLVAEAALVDLETAAARLERHRIALPSVTSDYLRIRRTDGGPLLPLSTIAALPQTRSHRVAAAPRRRLLDAVDVADPAGTYLYRADGPYSWNAVNLQLASDQAVAEVVVSSRAHADGPWRQRARFTAFRIGAGDDPLRNLEVPVAAGRDRHWRIETLPPLRRAPQLQLSYRPDRFLLMLNGQPPYQLAAGSARVRRNDAPLAAVMERMRAVHGRDFQPPLVAPGEGGELAGSFAYQPPAVPVDWRRLLLWAVLGAGALLLLLMLLTLLRQSGDRGE